MDNRIKQILQADKLARERISKAKESARETRLQVDKEIENIKTEYAEREKAEIELAAKNEKKKIDKAIIEQRQKNDKVLDAMNKIFNEKRKIWAEEIFKNVISS